MSARTHPMRKGRGLHVGLVLLMLSLSSCSDHGPSIGNSQPYPEELSAVLGRGLVALRTSPSQVFVTWRLLPDDPEEISFNVYRRENGAEDQAWELVSRTGLTNYQDRGLEGDLSYDYSVRPVSGGEEGEESRMTVLPKTPRWGALVFDLEEDIQQGRVATGDLTGDGALEVVVAYSQNGEVDPGIEALSKSDHTIKVTAFLRSGERMWTIDLGWGIEAGPYYQPLVVWDINADGRAEILLKTNKSGHPRYYDGERLTVLNGETGEVIREAPWPSADGLGDYYNSDSRNYLAVAHLDGRNPYIIATRGLYKTQRIWAYNVNLELVWERVIGRDLARKKDILFKVKRKLGMVDISQGSHTLPIADLDGDGKEEILWGEHCLGEHGQDLWVIEKPYPGQPDLVIAADVLPSRPGLEVYYAREGHLGREDERIGVLLADSRGQTIWAHWGCTHVDGGWVARIIPGHEGMQCYSFDVRRKKIDKEGMKYDSVTHFLWDSNGELLGQPNYLHSLPIDWDSDGVYEICTPKGEVRGHDGTIHVDLKGRCIWAADLFGDHREEVVLAPQDGKIYIVFNTEARKESPRVTRLANRQVRNDLSRTAMADPNFVMTNHNFEGE